MEELREPELQLLVNWWHDQISEKAGPAPADQKPNILLESGLDTETLKSFIERYEFWKEKLDKKREEIG